MKKILFTMLQLLISFSLLSSLLAMEQPPKPGQKLLISRAQQGNTSAQLQLAQDYLDQGNLKDALMWAKKAIASSIQTLVPYAEDFSPQAHALTYFIEGKIIEKQNIAEDRNRAKAALEKYNLAAKYGSWQAQNRLGELAAQEKNFEEAKRWYMQAASSNQNSVYDNLGKLAEQQEDYKEARKWYQKSGNTNALALIHKKEGNRTEAKKLLGIAANRNCGYAYYHLGLMAFEENDLQKAEYNFNKALTAEICSDEPTYLGDVYYYLARIYQKQQKASEYKEALLKAVTYSHPGAAHRLGMIYFNQGEKEHARQMFLLAAEQNKVRSFFNLGALAEREKDLTAARRYYKQASDLGYSPATQRLRTLIERSIKQELAKKAQTQ